MNVELLSLLDERVMCLMRAVAGRVTEECRQYVEKYRRIVEGTATLDELRDAINEIPMLDDRGREILYRIVEAVYRNRDSLKDKPYPVAVMVEILSNLGVKMGDSEVQTLEKFVKLFDAVEVDDKGRVRVNRDLLSRIDLPEEVKKQFLGLMNMYNLALSRL